MRVDFLFLSSLHVNDGIINIISVNSCMFDSNFTSSKPIAHIITPDFSSDHI